MSLDGTKSANYFANIDPVVKDAIRKFLPIETLTDSAATSKLFNAMMSDKGTWVKMAKQLKIEPQSSETAKAEVITRLKANACALKLLPPNPDRNKDPFQLPAQIKEEISQLSDSERKNLMEKFRNLIKEYRTTYKDKIKLETILAFFREGVMARAKKADWEQVKYDIIKKDYGGKACPEDLLMFQALVDQLKSSRLDEFGKQEVMGQYFGCFGLQGNHTDMAYKAVESLFKAGFRPDQKQFDRLFSYCRMEQYAKKDSLLHLMFGYATPNEKQFFAQRLTISENRFKQDIHEWVSRSIDIFAQEFDNYDAENREDSLKHEEAFIYKYIHNSELIASLQGKPADTKQIAEKRAQVLKMIEEGEKSLQKEFETRAKENPALFEHFKLAYKRYKEAANYGS